ncbi:hypothetical protein niasHT_020797 [Heterodera trifolii]|uniref:Uncharacterized protein n=1 Tax=Heterodera trifolii TaxID=157864 RepID=A0ABD2KEW7_9BILA
MRSLQKSPYYCGQFGLVQRFGRQKEHRRDFGVGRRGDQKGDGIVGDGSASGGGGGQRQMQQIGKDFSQQMFDHIGAIDDSPSASSSLLIGISELQRALLGIGSAVMSLVDPKRGDMVATMGETTVPHSLLKHLRDRLSRDVSGAELLRSRPRISGETIDRRWLATLPNGTMGREYLSHRRQLIERNIPWVVQQAERGRFLLALDWERRFEQKIVDLQRECSIEPFSAECSNE